VTLCPIYTVNKILDEIVVKLNPLARLSAGLLGSLYAVMVRGLEYFHFFFTELNYLKDSIGKTGTYITPCLILGAY